MSLFAVSVVSFADLSVESVGSLSEFPQPEMLLIASAVDKKTDIHFFKYFPFMICFPPCLI